MKTILDTYKKLKERYEGKRMDDDDKNLMQMMEIALSHPEDWESMCGDCIDCGEDENGFPVCLLESPQFAYSEGCYMFETEDEADEELSLEEMQEDLEKCILVTEIGGPHAKEAAEQMMKEIIRNMEERKRKTEDFQTCDSKPVEAEK